MPENGAATVFSLFGGTGSVEGIVRAEEEKLKITSAKASNENLIMCFEK